MQIAEYESAFVNPDIFVRVFTPEGEPVVVAVPFATPENEVANVAKEMAKAKVAKRGGSE